MNACRSCGATLSPAISWCGQCLAPVDEPAAPQPLARGVRDRRTAHEHTYSRWHAGPTTFGPLGRVLSTILVLSFGPWTGMSFFALLWTPVWVPLSTILLRQIWRREPVVAEPDHETRGPSRRPAGPATTPNVRAMLLAGAILAAGGLVLVLATGSTVTRFVVLSLLVLVALGLAVERLAGL